MKELIILFALICSVAGTAWGFVDGSYPWTIFFALLTIGNLYSFFKTINSRPKYR